MAANNQGWTRPERGLPHEWQGSKQSLCQLFPLRVPVAGVFIRSGDGIISLELQYRMQHHLWQLNELCHNAHFDHLFLNSVHEISLFSIKKSILSQEADNTVFLLLEKETIQGRIVKSGISQRKKHLQSFLCSLLPIVQSIVTWFNFHNFDFQLNFQWGRASSGAKRVFHALCRQSEKVYLTSMERSSNIASASLSPYIRFTSLLTDHLCVAAYTALEAAQLS